MLKSLSLIFLLYSRSYLIIQRFFHGVQRIQWIDWVVQMCERIVYSVVSIADEISIQTRWVFDGISVRIKLLISLVVVAEKKSFKLLITCTLIRVYNCFTFDPSYFHLQLNSCLDSCRDSWPACCPKKVGKWILATSLCWIACNQDPLAPVWFRWCSLV